MRRQFRQTIMELAEYDDKIVLVFGDVSLYLFKEYREKYPNRFYNMGVCENTILSASSGLSSVDFHVFAHTIAPFLTERSYEQIKLDLCFNKFGVNIVTCGASFDYAWDGATHHCYTDLAILRLLPNMEVIQPGSKKELDVLLRSQYDNRNSTYFRLSDHPHKIEIPTVEFGKGVILKDNGSKLTVMTAGPILGNVFEACEDLDINLVYFHTIKPIDKNLISKFKDTEILVIHDAFGLHEAISEVPNILVSKIGMPDSFCSWYGTLYDIRKQIGLDVDSIRKAIQEKIKN